MKYILNRDAGKLKKGDIINEQHYMFDVIVGLGWLDEVNEKWVPKKRDTYFYVDAELNSNDTTNDRTDYDVELIRVNNYFRTKEEAEAAALKVKELFASLKK